MTLKDKRVVILGGSSGIGFEIAAEAAREGAKVVIASSNEERVGAALAKLPAEAVGQVVNLGDEKSIAALFGRLGPIDHLVYTAGEQLKLSSLAAQDIAAARDFFTLRYWGAYAAAKYGSPNIRKGGSIVFTSGIAGARPNAGWSVASSICSAMEGLTRALAVELAPIRVNIVSPGVVKTPLWAGMSETDREALYEQTAAHLPVGHVGEPQEIAEAYMYLMRQTYGTGQVIVADGGAVLV